MAQQLQASGFNSLTVPLLHSHLQRMLRHDDSTQSLLEKPKLIFCFIYFYFFLAVKVLLLVWVKAECLCKTSDQGFHEFTTSSRLDGCSG